MVIAERLRQLREGLKLSQGEIEKRTGLLRCYTSRVENGHTVPCLETLEKYARALEVPVWKLFMSDEDATTIPADLRLKGGVTAKSVEGDPTTVAIRKALKNVTPSDRKLILRFVLSITKGARRAA